MSDDPDGFTAAERGDTVGRRTRVLIRLVAALVLVAAALTVAAVRENDQQDGPGQLPSAAPSDTTATDKVADPLAHAAREVRLLADEDARLREISLGEAGHISHVDGTLVLGARRAPYTLADLVRSGAATQVSRSVVLVTEPVAVRRDATLVVHAPGTQLRLLSSPKRFTSLVSWGGSLTLVGAKGRPLEVSGWDNESDRADKKTGDGRAYVRVKDGTLRAHHVDFRDLGFWSGRTGGLSVTGSNETDAVATVSHVRLDYLHIGFYASGAQRVRLEDAVIKHPDRNGVELTNQSHDIDLSAVTVRKPGEDGISVSNGTSQVGLTGVHLGGAAGYGLDVNGSPLATGPNSAGYGIGNYAGLHVMSSMFTGNALGGVRIQSVDHVEFMDSGVAADRDALVVEGRSSDVQISGTTLASADATGLVLADGVTDVSLGGDSEVTGHAVGVEVDDSAASIDGTTISVGTGHGIHVSGGAAKVTLGDNRISGRGSGAVAASNGAGITENGTTTGDWTYRPEVFMWGERHSAAAPLLLVLIVPVIGLVFILRRRRQQRELRRLLEETLVAQGRAAISTYRHPSVPVLAPDSPVGPVVVPAPVVEPVFGPVREPARAAPEPVVGPAVEHASPEADPLPLSDREFGSGQEFAVAAVLEAGYPPSMVARVLNVPTSRVRAWVAQARLAAPGGPSDDEDARTRIG